MRILLCSTQPVYLGFVQTLFDQIGAQLEGLYWKDGGPIVACQLENEVRTWLQGLFFPPIRNGVLYSWQWGGSYTYLETLLGMARGAGLAPAAFTKTGWPGEPEPWGMLLPYYGGYAAGRCLLDRYAYPITAMDFFPCRLLVEIHNLGRQ